MVLRTKQYWVGSSGYFKARCRDWTGGARRSRWIAMAVPWPSRASMSAEKV